MLSGSLSKRRQARWLGAVLGTGAGVGAAGGERITGWPGGWESRQGGEAVATGGTMSPG